MRLLASDIAGVGDARKTITNSALTKHGVDLAVRVRDYRSCMLLPDSVQHITRPGKDLVPIGGLLRILDQSIASRLIEGRDLAQQVRMKRPPKTVIHLAAHQPLIEFLLRAPLHSLPGAKVGVFALA